jgi:hypothetical protein
MSKLARQAKREVGKDLVKAKVDIKDAWIDTSMGAKNHFLWGKPVNHPTESINGSLVHTSFIVKVEGNVVETKHNVYNVLNWDEKKLSPQAELF